MFLPKKLPFNSKITFPTDYKSHAREPLSNAVKYEALKRPTLSTCTRARLHGEHSPSGAVCSTYVGAGGVLVGVLVEPPGSSVVHLQQRDTALTPHLLRQVHGQERVKDEAHQAPTHRPGI